MTPKQRHLEGLLEILEGLREPKTSLVVGHVFIVSRQ